MNLDDLKRHNGKVSAYFEKASVNFDTFYDHKRNAFMQWVDRQFRSDVFNRYFLTFETLIPMKGKTVIDIGCGSGPYVVEAAKRGAEKVVGLDIAKGMLDLAQQRAEKMGLNDRCEFIQGNFPEDAPAETFDYSITMGVMDYVANAEEFLNILARKVTGKSVLSFPCYHWYRGPIRKLRYWIKRCPVYFYKAEEIEGYARSAGFSGIDIKKMPGAGQDYFVRLDK